MTLVWLLVALALIPVLLFKIYPPEVTHTPDAAAFAGRALDRMGPMSRGERMMLGVFIVVALLWTTTRWHGINYTVVALMGVCFLIITNVVQWDDVMGDRAAWDVFIWYGGLVRMAEALGETGITKRFAEVAASLTVGWQWGAALIALVLVLLPQLDDLLEDFYIEPLALGLSKDFLLLLVQLLQFAVDILDPLDERTDLAAGNGDVRHGASLLNEVVKMTANK